MPMNAMGDIGTEMSMAMPIETELSPSMIGSSIWTQNHWNL